MFPFPVSYQETEAKETALYNVGYMQRKFFFLLFLFTGLPVWVAGQQTALKTNAIFWATTTPNAGVEIGISHNITVDIWGGYNAWKFPDNMKLNLYLLQPEVRYWFCRKFEGQFVGLHGHYGHFNIGQIPFIPGLKEHTLRGNFYGGGLSYGYHWALGERWGIEAMLGVGYAYMKYDKLRCAECGEREGSYTRTYFGPTRIGISFIYFLR